MDGKRSLKDQIYELKESLGSNLFRSSNDIPEELSLKELIELAIIKLEEFDKLKALLSYKLDNADRYLIRGKEKLYLRDYAGAITEFHKAIELDPGLVEAKQDLKIAKKKLEEQKNENDQSDGEGE